jgi:hypothetical protein
MIRETSKEDILWTVADAGWTTVEKLYIMNSVDQWNNITIKFFSRIEVLISYINNGVDGKSRASDPITATYVFSHGIPGQIALGYHHSNADALAFTADKINSIKPNAFSTDAYFVLYSCRAGSTKDGATNFAQTLADWTGKDVIATYSGDYTEGRTDYGQILGLTDADMLLVTTFEFSLFSLKKYAEAVRLYLQTPDYEKEREAAVGGVGKPYPALQLPTLSDNIITEWNPHWVTYKKKT